MESTRPLVVGLAFSALLAVALVVLLPDCASACSCATLPSTPQERVRDMEAVFIGEVVDFDKPPPETTMIEGTTFFMGGSGREATVTLRVSEVWEGPRRQTATVTTEADSGVGCGYPFEEGREHLVYASGEGSSVGLCSETKPLSEAGADLEALGDGEAPNGGDTLSDTSGGIPARAMAALATLAVAVSFVLATRFLRIG